MPDKFNDDQGTRISEDKTTGSGAEATRGTDGRPARDGEKHRSGYGGDAGKPKPPNEPPRGDQPKDVPTSRR